MSEAEGAAEPQAADARDGTVVYYHKPRPVGGIHEFRIEGDRFVVAAGRGISVPLSAIRQIRLTFEPRSFAGAALKATLTTEDGRRIAFTSMNWRSMVDGRSHAVPYGRFVAVLLARLAKASPGCRFVAGTPMVQWALLALVTAGTLVAIAVFAWRALSSGAISAGLLGVLIGGFGIWQLEPMVRLNKPRIFDPGNPPPELVPRAA